MPGGSVALLGCDTQVRDKCTKAGARIRAPVPWTHATVIRPARMPNVEGARARKGRRDAFLQAGVWPMCSETERHVWLLKKCAVG